MLAWLSSASRALALGAVATLAACPDPGGTFDKFRDRVIDGSTTDLPSGMLEDISGDFLMGFAVIISPTQPLKFQATNQLTMNTDGTGTLDITLQPLDITTSAPVGDALVSNDVPVNSAGQFTITLTQANIPGEANPITGNDIVGDFEIVGTIRSVDLACGLVNGNVTAPTMLPVDGSTFAMVRIPAGGPLPPLQTACPVEMPDAGPPDASQPDAAP